MLFFKRGLKLEDRKLPAALMPSAQMHCRATLTVPLSFTETPEAVPLSIGATVKKGESIYEDRNGMPCSSPAAGTLVAYVQAHHPLYGDVVCGSVKPEDGETVTLGLGLDPKSVIPPAIVQAARTAGIIDEIDGVPLYQKLESWQKQDCFVVADAVEAQPFASAAFCVLCEQSEAVLKGLALAAKAVGAVGSTVAVCLENPAMKERVQQVIPAEKLYFAAPLYPVTQFCKPTQAAVCRIGVQALAALYAAIYEDEAVASMVVTVAGDMVPAPQNVRVTIGTPVQSILDHCGVVGTPAAVIAGDAITGTALPDTACAVLPGMTCLLALSQLPTAENDPCIGCGRCAQVCHADLLPYEIMRRLENMHYERLARLRADACDACGACSYVCPAKRNVMGAVLLAAQSDNSVLMSWGGDDDV